jgi:hypothetical protein
VLNIFKYNRIRFGQMYYDARDYLTSKFLQVGEVFTPASAYGQILQVLIDLGKLIFYYVEDSITELNIYTSTRDVSVRNWARIAGHNPTRAISATGSVKLTYNGNPLNIYGNTIIIPKHTRLINNVNNLSYIIDMDGEETRMNLIGKNSIELRVIQGVIETQRATGNGAALQSYNFNGKRGALIDNFNVKVYVNGDQWKIYESLYDIPFNANGCIVKTGINGGLDLYFGNKYFGRIPDLGATIQIEYISTSGNGGNIFDSEASSFTFAESLYDTIGTPVDANEAIDISVFKPILFGSDPEPIALTKILAPKTSKAFVLANADSYVYFLEKFNIFSVIDAFNTFDDDDITDDNVVYLFLIPDVNKRKPASADYFSVPIQLFLLTDDEKEKIYDYIEQSGQKIMGTEIKILDPIVKKYVMNVNVIAIEGYSKDTIRQSIISKCSDYFLKNRRRDRIPKSDIISIIETVEGVDSVNIWFVSEENEAFKKDPNNVNLPDKGIDVFGDIIINRGEYALVRGGWETRTGYIYYDTVDQGKPGSVNVAFGKDTSDTLNLSIHRINIDQVKNS